jgi:prevent-host-death family protein
MMETVNIHEAKTHLSRLMEKVANGESFIIAKAGKPIGKLVPLDEAEKPKKAPYRVYGGRDCRPG